MLGGLFTDHLTWRWVFYINVPIALVIVILALRLLPPARSTAERHVIDDLGIALVAAGAAGLILATSWGGIEYAWSSGTILGLFATSTVCLGLFAVVEHRAAEPVLPLRLFRRNVFSICAVLSFIVGFALLGCMTFLPTYLQYCQGVSATMSGVRMLPMVIGLVVASVSAGTVVSRTGRYKVFPISGAVVIGIGMYLLSLLDEKSTTLRTSLAMLVLGVGIGLAMQVLTIVVQNTVDYEDLGVATSGVTFFRTMGSSFGAAIFGTIYVNQLTPNLSGAVAQSGTDPNLVTTPAGVNGLPSAQRSVIVHAYAESLQTVFRYAVPVALVAFVVALALKQVPMRGLAQAGARDVGRGFGMPDQRSSQEQLEEQIVRILRTKLPLVALQLLAESGTGMDSVQLWTVRQIAIHQHRYGVADPVLIARSKAMPVGVIQPALDDAERAGLIETHNGGFVLTERGRADFRTVVERLRIWVEAEVEEYHAAPLDDTSRDQLLQIARRLALNEDERLRTPLPAS